jgi:hypothetical protein
MSRVRSAEFRALVEFGESAFVLRGEEVGLA